MAGGSYRTLDGRYVIERGWADHPATDRRRQTWVLAEIDNQGGANILSDHTTLRGARAELDRVTRLGRRDRP